MLDLAAMYFSTASETVIADGSFFCPAINRAARISTSFFVGAVNEIDFPASPAPTLILQLPDGSFFAVAMFHGCYW